MLFRELLKARRRKAAERPEGSGWEPVPFTRVNGWRKRDGKGGWEYWYPPSVKRPAKSDADLLAWGEQREKDPLAAVPGLRELVRDLKAGKATRNTRVPSELFAALGVLAKTLVVRSNPALREKLLGLRARLVGLLPGDEDDAPEPKAEREPRKQKQAKAKAKAKEPKPARLRTVADLLRYLQRLADPYTVERGDHGERTVVLYRGPGGEDARIPETALAAYLEGVTDPADTELIAAARRRMRAVLEVQEPEPEPEPEPAFSLTAPGAPEPEPAFSLTAPGAPEPEPEPEPEQTAEGRLRHDRAVDASQRLTQLGVRHTLEHVPKAELSRIVLPDGNKLEWGDNFPRARVKGAADTSDEVLLAIADLEAGRGETVAKIWKISGELDAALRGVVDFHSEAGAPDQARWLRTKTLQQLDALSERGRKHLDALAAQWDKASNNLQGNLRYITTAQRAAQSVLEQVDAERARREDERVEAAPELKGESRKTFQPRGGLQWNVFREIVEGDEQPLTWEAVVARANAYDEALDSREGEGADFAMRPFLRKLRDAALLMAERMVEEGFGPGTQSEPAPEPAPKGKHKIKGTRYTYTTLGDWWKIWLEVGSRRASAPKHEAQTATIASLASAAGKDAIAASTDEELAQVRAAMEADRGFRGHRGEVSGHIWHLPSGTHTARKISGKVLGWINDEQQRRVRAQRPSAPERVKELGSVLAYYRKVLEDDEQLRQMAEANPVDNYALAAKEKLATVVADLLANEAEFKAARVPFPKQGLVTLLNRIAEFDDDAQARVQVMRALQPIYDAQRVGIASPQEVDAGAKAAILEEIGDAQDWSRAPSGQASLRRIARRHIYRHTPKDQRDKQAITERVNRLVDEVTRPPEQTQPAPEPVTEGEARQQETEAAIASVLEKQELASQMGQSLSERQRKQKNRDAVALARKAIRSGEPLSVADRKTLAAYSGEGGIGGSLNQYFTRPDLAAGIWGALKRFGLPETPAVLEPACGAGVFLTVAPEGSRVTGVEIDRDPADVATLLHPDASIWHQSLEEYAVAREGTEPDQDVVVGNAPFVQRTGGFAALHKPEVKSADAYFLDTSLDRVKPGGLVGMIVHRSVMSDQSAAGRKFRRRLLARAELVDAYRLPDSAFAHTGTSVVSDVLFLRKRSEVDRAAAEILLGDEDSAKQLEPGAQGMIDGGFFDEHPDRVLGKTLTAEETGWRATVAGKAEDIVPAIERLSQQPVGLGEHLTRDKASTVETEAGEAAARAKPRPLPAAPALGATRDFGVGASRATYVWAGDPPLWQRVDNGVAQAVLDTSDETTREAIDLAQRIGEFLKERDAGEYHKARGLRRTLRPLVKRFVEQHGNPRDSKTLSQLAQSSVPALLNLLAAVTPEGNLSRALETDGAQAPVAETVDPTDLSSVLEYVALHNDGELDLAEIQSTWQQAPEARKELRAVLLQHPDVCIEAGGELVTKDRYLSGKLYAKLDALANKPELEHQAAMLREAIRERRRLLTDVTLDIGAKWLPPEVLTEFFSTEEGLRLWRQLSSDAFTKRVGFAFDHSLQGVEIQRDEHGIFSATLRSSPTYNNREGARLEIPADRKAHPILLWLNKLRRSADDIERMAMLNRDFTAWLASSEYAESIEDLYNRTYYGDVPFQYSGADLGIAGVREGIVPHGFQNETVRWADQTGSGVMALDVGLGKTFAGILLAQKLRNEGKIRRPMIVVPKSVLRNWAEEVETLLPGSRVLVIGEHGVGKPDADGRYKRYTSDSAAQINQKLADMRQGDYDFVVISKERYANIPLTPETLHALENDPSNWTSHAVQRQDALDRADKKKSAKAQEKAREREKARWDAEKRTRELRATKSKVFFEDLGVDCVIADEAHAYKNLNAVASMYGSQPKFLGGSATSKISQAMLYKNEVIRQRAEKAGNPSRVYYLTATPSKNSPLEIFNMLMQVAPLEMIQRGVKNVDEFVERYCRVEMKYVPSLSGTGSEDQDHEETGDLVERPCVTGFCNMSELNDLMQKYLMVRTADDVGLKIPDSNRTETLVEMSPEQKEEWEALREEVAADAKSDDPTRNLLSSVFLMQQVANDLYSYGKAREKMREDEPNPYTPEDAKTSPKYQAACDSIAAGAKGRGGQIVFHEQIEVHEILKQMLVDRGIPAEQIGVINAKVAPNASDRQAIGDKFNRGEIKVVIGNTPTMGEGVNLQGKKHEHGTTDIHHVDQPWDPGSLHQREGRGVRQGNRAEQCDVHTYGTKDSFDGYRLAALAGKRRWLSQLMSGEDQIDNQANIIDELEELAAMAKYSLDSEGAADFVAKQREKAEKKREWQLRAKARAAFYSVQRLVQMRDAARKPERRAQLDQHIADKVALVSRDPLLTEQMREALKDTSSPTLVSSDGKLIREGSALHTGVLHTGVGAFRRVTYRVDKLDFAKQRATLTPAWAGNREAVTVPFDQFEHAEDKHGNVYAVSDAPVDPRGPDLDTLHLKAHLLCSARQGPQLSAPADVVAKKVLLEPRAGGWRSLARSLEKTIYAANDSKQPASAAEADRLVREHLATTWFPNVLARGEEVKIAVQNPGAPPVLVSISQVRSATQAALDVLDRMDPPENAADRERRDAFRATLRLQLSQEEPPPYASAKILAPVPENEDVLRELFTRERDKIRREGGDRLSMLPAVEALQTLYGNFAGKDNRYAGEIVLG